MTVHIDRITAEVSTPPAPEQRPAATPTTPWAERDRIAAAVAAAERDRRRTSTGDGLD